jgi:hypothetical protein
MYLDVAPKEERCVIDVANAGPPPPAGDFSQTEPLPHHPERDADPEVSKTSEWDPRGAETPSSDLVEVKRGDPRDATAVHHPLAACATKEDGQLHQRAPTAARTRAALIRQCRRPGCRSAPPEKQSREILAATVLGSSRRLSGGLLWRRQGGGRWGRRGSVARVSSPPELPQSEATRGPSEAFSHSKH